MSGDEDAVLQLDGRIALEARSLIVALLTLSC